jgi:hypothetical protein
MRARPTPVEQLSVPFRPAPVVGVRSFPARAYAVLTDG